MERQCVTYFDRVRCASSRGRTNWLNTATESAIVGTLPAAHGSDASAPMAGRQRPWAAARRAISPFQGVNGTVVEEPGFDGQAGQPAYPAGGVI